TGGRSKSAGEVQTAAEGCFSGREDFMPHLPRDLRLAKRARELRKNMTPHERRLWYDFLRTYPVKFYRQRIIDFFIVDFYCASAKLVVEIDGSQHYTEQGQAYDAERSAILSQYHLKVLRFSNREIGSHFEGVCRQIHTEVQTRLAGD